MEDDPSWKSGAVAFQKPYSSSPGARSQGRGFRRPALPNVGARRRWDGETMAAAQQREEKNTNLLPLDFSN